MAFKRLVKSQMLKRSSLDLDELMRYPLTPVPYSLGTADGYFNKTNKAEMKNYLAKQLIDTETTTEYANDVFFIQDGNAMFHSMVDIPPTFKGIALRLLDAMIKHKKFIFSTDCYNQFSIKAQERIRRGVSPKHLVPGPATKKPNDFKLFLCNDENKQQLCRLLLKVWSSDDAYSRINQCDSAMLVVDGKLYSLSPINGKVSHDASTSSYTFNNSPTWHNLLTV